METFPERWLTIIGKHLRKQLGLSPDAPLPEYVRRGLEQLRASEMERLSCSMASITT